MGGRSLQKQLPPVEEAPRIQVSFDPDVMNSNFEDWMKMATDNVSLTTLY